MYLLLIVLYLCLRILTYSLTYSLTPWCRVLLDQLIGLQLVKKFPAFHGTRSFITALTTDQTDPGAKPGSCTIGTGSFPGIKSGRGVTLTPHPLLMPWSR